MKVILSEEFSLVVDHLAREILDSLEVHYKDVDKEEIAVVPQGIDLPAYEMMEVLNIFNESECGILILKMLEYDVFLLKWM